MKISQMLEREDFYPILEQTLNQYFGFTENQRLKTRVKGKSNVFGYVYEHINAIVSKNPDKKVKEFLYTEYRTKSLIKRIFAQIYLRLLLNTGGLFADKVLINNASTKLSNYLLIYPCNKKIRIFNFNENFVDVVVKYGFSINLIAKEIEYREQYYSPHILPIVSKTENSYREHIIDGIPLARITHKKKYIELRAQSLKILRSEISNYEKSVDAKVYVEKLKKEFFKKIDGSGLEQFNKTYDKLSQIVLDNFKNIPVVLSHGDFHHGNVWVENKSDKIYIIDFETYCERSRFYDSYSLYHNLRSYGFHKTMQSLIHVGGSDIVGNKNIGGILALVLMEDYLFQASNLVIFNSESKKKELISYNSKVAKVVEKIERND